MELKKIRNKKGQERNRNSKKVSPLNKSLKSLEETSFVQHCLRHQKTYLLLLFVILSGVILFNNFREEKPLLTDAESYYHLSLAREVSLKTGYYYPLHLLERAVGINERDASAGISNRPGYGDKSGYLVLLPLLLAVSTLLLLWSIAKRLGLSPLFTLFFILFLILTPSFLKSATTLSASLLFFFLFCCSFFFFLQPAQKKKYLAVFSSAAIAFIDWWSVFLTIILFFLYALKVKKEKREERRPVWISLVVMLFFAAAVSFFSSLPFILGPFHSPQLMRDLVSDFGGFSGMSFFVIVAAILGFIISWPERASSAFPYLALPLLVPAYIYSTEIILPLSIIFIFFAAQAILNLCKRQWQLPTLQRLTLFLLLLGVFFSSLTYAARLENASPTRNDLDVLSWMKEELPPDSRIASFAEDADYVRYFATKEPLFAIHDQDTEKETANNQIFNAVYVHQLFPVLEEQNVKYIYLSAAAAEHLPQEQGLLFLFQNERFKLLYSAGQSGVWEFTPPQELTT